MARSTSKTLSFPLGGVSKKASYRKQTRPYSSPNAVNVRGVGGIEDRERGGSRPGLVRVGDSTTMGQVVTATTDELLWPDGNPVEWADGSVIDLPDVLQWPNGEPIEWADGSVIDCSTLEMSIVSPDGMKIVCRSFDIDVSASKGSVPDDYSLTCIYRDRLILVKNNLWYASRMGDYTDWDVGADLSDTARAVAGSVALSGVAGEDITALIPFRDKMLVIATRNSLWMLHGDPCDGRIECLSSDVGVIAPYGWTVIGESFAFLSNDGVYICGFSGAPARFSEENLPGALQNVDTELNSVILSYDNLMRGVHLFITPSDGDGTHYWIDLENKALWPVGFVDPGHQPVAVAHLESSGIREVVMLGRDNVWRKFDKAAVDDCGEAISSKVTIGPFRIATGDMRDAMLSEIHGILACGSGSVAWSVSMGSSAEAAVDNAVAGISSYSGMWDESRNRVVYPRCRGSWAVVVLSSNTKWSFEAVAIGARQLGRVRI